MMIEPGCRCIYRRMERHGYRDIPVEVMEKGSMTRFGHGTQLWKVKRLDLPENYNRRHKYLFVADYSLYRQGERG